MNTSRQRLRGPKGRNIIAQGRAKRRTGKRLAPREKPGRGATSRAVSLFQSFGTVQPATQGGAELALGYFVFGLSDLGMLAWRC